MSSIKTGFAQLDYTPRLGLPIAGNYRDDYAARGVHDFLRSKAIVFQNAKGSKVALIVLDISSLNRQCVAFMREKILAATGIPPERVLVAATHSHAAPMSKYDGPGQVAAEADVKKFLARASGVVQQACRNMKNYRLAIGYGGENRVSFVRRLACRDGRTHMNWEGLDPKFVIKALGRIDPEIIALEVREGGERRAALVNFALHPAILAGDNWLYSADYPGYLAEALDKISGRNICTLFFNGCCGNVNHIDYSDPLQGRGYQMTQRVGYLLAADVQQALADPVEIKGDTVAAKVARLRLMRLKISEKQRIWSEKIIKEAKTKKRKGQVDGLPDIVYARIYQDMYRKQKEADCVELMTIRVGDLGVVGLPGEIFAELGLAIKKQSPARHTLVIELANDAVGYIPDKPAFKLGGYEPSVGSTQYVPGTGELMVKTAVAQLEMLFR